jgi:hypothetical protein
MIFKTESLSFLNIFNSVAKGVSPTQQVTTIKTSEDKKHLIFYLVTDRCIMIQKLDNPSGEEFSGTYDTSKLQSVIKDCDLAELSWEQGKISWEGTEIELTQPEIIVADIEPYLEVVEKKPKKKFTLTDLHLLKLAKNFIGDKFLASVLICKGNLQAMNGNIGAIIPIVGKDSLKFHIPSPILNLLPLLSETSLEVSHHVELGAIGDLSIYRSGNLMIFIPDEIYHTPDMTQKEYVENYEHPYSFGFDKGALEKAIQRMTEILKDDPNRTISLKIEKIDGYRLTLNSTESESKMTQYIPLTDDTSEDLDKVSFKVNADIFKFFLKTIPTTSLRVYLTKKPDELTLIKVKSVGDSQIFLVKLLD